MTSGAALLWRLHHDLDHSREVERTTLEIVGGCFVALAAYILYESGSTLIGHAVPERSIPSIVIAAASVVIRPMLARAKRRIAAGIGSAAMQADSRQADFCTYLSAILLGCLLLNAILGWWWADPVAGLVMAPSIAKEGVDGIRGKGLVRRLWGRYPTCRTARGAISRRVFRKQGLAWKQTTKRSATTVKRRRRLRRKRSATRKTR